MSDEKDSEEFRRGAIRGAEDCIKAMREVLRELEGEVESVRKEGTSGDTTKTQV